MLATLNNILPDATHAKYAVPCFNCFGYEDTIAVIEVAESLNRAVIVAVNKDMIEYMPMQAIFGFIRPLAEQASVPVVVHLDHAYDIQTIFEAVDLGATSVMYDGSQLSLHENINNTAQVVAYAHKYCVSVEGEIGSVPYTEGRDYIKHILTDPQDAKTFCQHSGVDAVAISIGNIHKRPQSDCVIHYDLLRDIEQVVHIPLVIHGASGIITEDLQKLATHKVAKFNIGTKLRQTFGHTLRQAILENPQQYDRLFFMKQTIPALKQQAEVIFNILSSNTDRRIS